MYETEPMLICPPNLAQTLAYWHRQNRIRHWLESLKEDISTDETPVEGLPLVLFTPGVKLDPSTPTEKNPVVR